MPNRHCSAFALPVGNGQRNKEGYDAAAARMRLEKSALATRRQEHTNDHRAGTVNRAVVDRDEAHD